MNTSIPSSSIYLFEGWNSINSQRKGKVINRNNCWLKLLCRGQVWKWQFYFMLTLTKQRGTEERHKTFQLDPIPGKQGHTRHNKHRHSRLSQTGHTPTTSTFSTSKDLTKTNWESRKSLKLGESYFIYENWHDWSIFCTKTKNDLILFVLFIFLLGGPYFKINKQF